MIEVGEVTKRDGSTVAVDGLSFEVREGEVTGFLGPSGAGKSTTMPMMVGLDDPTSGRVTIDGHRYQDLRFPLHHMAQFFVDVVADAYEAFAARAADHRSRITKQDRAGNDVLNHAARQRTFAPGAPDRLR
jgi:ABC-2 type transport system ATP-binding protein